MKAANGVNVVQILTPNAAGLSHNQYLNLQIGPDGIIFNNGTGIIKTQLAGYITGNPNLAGGTARVILNEVTGRLPTSLNGYMEVAGNKADLILANPNGIVGSGFGFINANRGVLTTGVPVFGGAGSLEAFRVEGGEINVGGDGLNAKGADKVELIARTVKLNAGLWGNEAKIVTGANQVNYNDGKVAAVGASASETPTVSLDVSALGGMYANKISLIGTETGVGVNSAGVIQASEDIHIDNAGNLTLTGTMTAKSADIKAAKITNRGLINSDQTQLKADDVTNIGTGRIYANTLGIQANSLTNDAENNSAAVIAARERLDIGAKNITNREHALLSSQQDMAIGGALDADNKAQGVAETVNNRSADIEAGKDLNIAAKTVNNTNEHFSTYVDTVKIAYFSEYEGSGSSTRYAAGTPGLYVYNDESDHLHTPTGNFEEWHRYDYTETTTETKVKTSDPAKILSGSAMTITADTLNNDKSHIIAAGALQGTVGTLNNVSFFGEHVVTDRGSVTSYWREHHKGSDSTGSRGSGYYPAPSVKAVDLTPTVYAQNKTQDVGQALIPDSALYSVNTNPSTHYLIETDPAFADYAKWISSDYMLSALSYNPSDTEKRLGDGFYEQKLLREQVLAQTGQRFLNGYENDDAQYKALMDNAVVFAKAHQLQLGVALTAAQMAQLTSDIVWLVEEETTLPNGQTARVLTPKLYLRSTVDSDLSADGLLSGKTVSLDISGLANNSGLISGQTSVAVTGNDIKNSGAITGQTVNIQAANDVDNIGGVLSGATSLTVHAGHDVRAVTTTSTQTNAQGSKTNLDRVAGLYVSGDKGQLVVTSGHDIDLAGAVIKNSGKEGTVQLAAGGSLNMGVVTQSQTNHLVWDAENRRDDSRSADTGASVQAQGDITLTAGSDMNAKAATVNTTDGTLLVKAGRDVNLTAGEETASVDEAHKHKGQSGGLSSLTITTRDALAETTAKSGSFSGNKVSVQAGRDINVQANNIVADQDTALNAAGNIKITSAQETSREKHLRQEKKTGIFASGVGFTIGSESQKTTTDGQTVTQAGATVGSTGANVTITAGKDAQIKASDVIAGKNIDISAQNVSIQAGENKEQENQTYEYKKSGLSVSVSSPAIEAVTTAVGYAQKAKGAQDERLSALYALKAGQSLEGIKGKVQNTVNGVPQKAEEGKKAPANRSDITVNISIGSSSYKQESRTQATSAQISNVSAGKDVNITATGSGAKDAAGKATDGDLNITGSNVSGENVNLQAAKDITLQAADNTTVSDSVSSGKSAGVGVQLGAAGTGVYAEASKSKGNTNGDASSHANTTVTAQKNLKTVSGNDTVLDGAKAKGETVVVQAGGDLKLASRQDSDNCAEKNTTTGGKIGTGNIGVSASANKSNIDSNYKSVTEQTGIYAGKGGFDIHVGQNTDLKGAVIASDATADKNKISTDTLTYSDIANKAEYSASSGGYAYQKGTGVKEKDKGLTPVIGTFAKGDADSATKSAVANGTIEIRSNPNQDISGLSRDTANSLNALGKIFDKKTVQEKQELAQIFGEIAYEEVHKLSVANGWGEGSTQKIALHAFVGGIMSQITGIGFKSGAVGAGVNEAVQQELKKLFKNQPDMWQWASALIGAAAAKIVGGNAQAGASAAVSGTKNNELSGIVEKRQLSEAQIEMYEKMQAELEESKTGVTDFMREYETLANWLYSDDKAVAAAGAYGSEGIMKTPIASMLLNHALYGNGEAMHFGFGESVSADLVNSAILKNGVKKAAADLSPGQTKYIYASIDYNNRDEDKNRPSTDQKLAYGNLKVAIQITRDENNNINFYGQAGDAYNFEYHNYVDKIERAANQGIQEVLKAKLITLINNGAVAYQNGGAMQPFTWTADIQGTIVEE